MNAFLLLGRVTFKNGLKFKSCSSLVPSLPCDSSASTYIPRDNRAGPSRKSSVGYSGRPCRAELQRKKMAAMALAAGEEEFDIWLGVKLRDLNTDEGIFGSYIKGILNGDESTDEKVEALEEILSEITEKDITVHCREIIDRWQKTINSGTKQNGTSNRDDGDMEDKLVKLLESQSLATVVQRSYTDDERRIREAILAQYSQIQVQEENEFEGQAEPDDDGLEKNTNASAIHQAERERREQAKLDSQRKKDKDKEDREKQKQLAAEKKEKRKTQKGERRR